MSIPEIWIERVHLGEGTEVMQRAIAADAEATARLEALAEADRAFHASFDEGAQLAAIERKLHVARTADAVSGPSRSWPWLAALVPAAAALLALLIALPGPQPGEGLGDDLVTTRPKLDPAVRVYQRTARGAETVQRGEVFHEGAELQLGYVSEHSHGVLLSVDGRGVVTVHMPDGDDTSMKPGIHTLDHGYQLDDAPRFERFFLVTSDEPLDVGRTVEAARAVGRSATPLKAELEVPDTASVVDFTIKKVSR